MNQRYLSVDFFRGMTMALMLVVNNPGTWSHVFSPLQHADWHGCTPTDLVFPFFLFIIGVSMWFSFEKYGRTFNEAVLKKIIRRSVILILLGLAMAKFPYYWKQVEVWRFPGVLQRLGLCYGLAAITCLLLPNRILLALGALILTGYWALLYWGNPTDPYALTDNIVRRVDLMVLGENHMWKGKGIPFDPEGLLSTLPAVVTVWMGWWSGKIMSARTKALSDTVLSLLTWGVVAGVSGLIWDPFFPINKSLWTSSYVLYGGGLAIIVLAFSVAMIDILHWKTGVKFFEIFGANPLFAFVLSGFIVKTMLQIRWSAPDSPNDFTHLMQWIYRTVFYPIDAGNWGSLLYALSFTFIIWLVCLFLYRRKIYVKI